MVIAGIKIIYNNGIIENIPLSSDWPIKKNGLVKKYPHVTILCDEIYDRLIFDEKEIPTFFNYPNLYDRLIILNGWSKTYAMTGWRLGWGVWPKTLIEHVFKFCVNNHSCVNAAA